MKRITRRSFLKTGAAISVGAAVPWSASGILDRSSSVDVAVVGAGLSGLITARNLVHAGLDVVVLDARSFPGGRILNQSIAGGAVVDAGGQWIGPSHTEMWSLASELGVPTFSTDHHGADLYAVGRQVHVQSESSDSPLRKEFDTVQAALELMAQTVPLDAPWLAAHARTYDALTLDQWLRLTGVSRGARVLFSKVTQSILGAFASDISLLYFLFYIASSGGLDPRIDATGGAQETRFSGGAAQLTNRLAAGLGSRVRSSTPVLAIRWERRGGATVVAWGGTLRARRVVVAMMPADAGRIAYFPALPWRRQELMSRWPAAQVAKFNAVYTEPWWRGRDLSGQVSNLGTVYSVFDNTPASGFPGVLLAFAESEKLPTGTNARRALVLRSLVRFFGPNAQYPIDFVEADWSKQPWISGCVSPLGPEFLSVYGPALREPVGPIHWAGSETAAIWNGKMEGALRSGQRAAEEILEAW